MSKQHLWASPPKAQTLRRVPVRARAPLPRSGPVPLKHPARPRDRTTADSSTSPGVTSWPLLLSLTRPEIGGAPVEESTTPAEALASAAARDVIAMGVGAVMALHSVPEARARGALAGVATRFQVPVTAVAQAVLPLWREPTSPFA